MRFLAQQSQKRTPPDRRDYQIMGQIRPILFFSFFFEI